MFAELDALTEQFNFDPSIMQDIYSPRWNIPPTVPVLTVQPSSSEGQSGRNTARLLRWGMTGARSPRSRGSGRPLFNARAETVHRLPSFRQPFRERRCLVPASGFYEWQKDESGRTPIWFHREDDATVAFAGIWSAGRADDGDVDACAVITCAANELVAPVHQRMPVILPHEAYEDWLNSDTNVGTLLALVQPIEWPDMSCHPVSTEVNRAANDYPALVDRAAREMQFDLAGASDC